MASELYKVSVPGSLMLMGEHAVLQGKQAIVCAISKRIHMELIPNAAREIVIRDTRLGSCTQSLDKIQVQDPFKFVLQSISLFKDQTPCGFTLEINSEFSSLIGFGSSAAVTVATIAVLAKWLNIPLSQEKLFSLAKEVILTLQGCGSGADIAASIYGGVIGFSCATDPKRADIKRLPQIPNLTAIYCGYKTPTAEVIKIVQAAQAKDPQNFANIYAAMHECVLQAIAAIHKSDWRLLGKLFGQHHGLQAELGTSNQLLDLLMHLLSSQPQIYGAKISGAGLGDCVIGLGEVMEPIIPASDGMLQFKINIDPQGLTYASN